MLSFSQLLKGRVAVPIPTGANAIYDCFTDLHFGGRWQAGDGQPMAIFERFSTERVATLRLADRRQLAAALAGAENFAPRKANPAEMADWLDTSARGIEDGIAQLVEVMQCETGANTIDTIREIHTGLQWLRRLSLRLRHAKDTLDAEGIEHNYLLADSGDTRPLLVLTGTRLEGIISAILPALLSGRAAIIRSSLEVPLTTGLLFRHLLSAGFDGSQLSLLHLDYDLTEDLMASGRVRTLLNWLVPPASVHTQ